ncbi:MAG: hypothetical protein Q3979_01960 [Actinomycetaceae bacterium]|nr:hypothetical protein [Actinomycetaceae bacterium]
MSEDWTSRMVVGTKPRNLVRSPLFAILACVALVSAAVGTAQVTWGTQGGFLPDLSFTIYTAFQLFLFDSEIAHEQTGPFLFEVARWVAPLTTAAGVLAIFEAFAVDVRMRLHPLRAGHVVVLGCSERSRALIHQILGWDGATGVICVVVDTTPAEEIRSLKAEGVHVVVVDYDMNDTAADDRAIRRMRLSTALGMICLESEPENFGHVRWIAEHTPADQHVNVYVNSDSRRLREIFEVVINRHPNFHMHYFSLAELACYELLGSGKFSVLPSGLRLSRRFMAGKAGALEPMAGQVKATDASMAEIAAAVPAAHVIMFGVGEVGGELLGMLANLAVTSPLAPARITLVDRAASLHLTRIFSQVEDVSKIAEFHAIDEAPESRSVRDELARIGRTHPFTAAIFVLPDARDSLLSADFHASVLGAIPVAVWCQHRADVEPLLPAMPQGDDLHLFGLDTEVLNPERILSNRYLGHARRFNYVYAITAARMRGQEVPTDSEEAWTNLSTVKKESSFSLAMHADTKFAVLDRIARTFAGLDGLTLADYWQQRLQGLSVAQQVAAIAGDPLLNYMAALEHHRWAISYYLRGFTYGPDKDELRRVHDCLVDDWDEFLAGPRRDTIVYDAFASLVIDRPLSPGQILPGLGGGHG